MFSPLFYLRSVDSCLRRLESQRERENSAAECTKLLHKCKDDGWIIGLSNVMLLFFPVPADSDSNSAPVSSQHLILFWNLAHYGGGSFPDDTLANIKLADLHYRTCITGPIEFMFLKHKFYRSCKSKHQVLVITLLLLAAVRRAVPGHFRAGCTTSPKACVMQLH